MPRRIITTRRALDPARRGRTGVGALLACLVVLSLAALTVTGCASSVDRGRQDAKDLALYDAKRYIRDVEVAAIRRSDLGDGSVRYLRGALDDASEQDQVLDWWSRPSTAEPGVVGWVDAALTRTSTNTVWSEGATVTTCLRFEVSWSDGHGAQYSYYEKDCPADVLPTPAR